jgi:hypothetical protein
MNNLAVWLEQTDPAAVMELTAAAIELTERTGRDPFNWRVALARETTERGGFADAEEILDNLETGGDDALVKTIAMERRLIAALRGDEAAHDALIGGDMFGEGMSEDFRINNAADLYRTFAILGRIDEGREFARNYEASTAISAMRLFGVAGFVSLLRRDPDGAASAHRSILAIQMTHSAPRRAFLETLEAGLAALGGRPREAATRMRDALASWRATGLLVEPSMAAVALISLLGRDEPEAAEAERELRERWDPLDGPGFKAFIERELAKPPVADRGAAARRPGTQVAEPAGTNRTD